MCWYLTNCIQKARTKPIIFLFWYKYPKPFQINWLFGYFKVHIHQNKTYQDPEKPDSKPTQKFIISEHGLNSKPK